MVNSGAQALHEVAHSLIGGSSESSRAVVNRSLTEMDHRLNRLKSRVGVSKWCEVDIPKIHVNIAVEIIS